MAAKGSIDPLSTEKLIANQIRGVFIRIDMVTVRAHPGLVLLGLGLVEMRPIHARFSAVGAMISFAAPPTTSVISAWLAPVAA